MKATKQELLFENTPDNIKQLNKIYEKDRYHARVYYMNTNSSTNEYSDFTQMSLYKFEDDKGDMDIVLFSKKYGITKTNKRYVSKKVEFRVRIRANGIWVTSDYRIRPYMLNDVFTYRYNEGIGNGVRKVMYDKLAWYRYLSEEFPHSDKSLNYYINNNLYTKKDIIKYEYGFDWPLSKVLYELDKKGNTFYGYTDYRKLQYYKPWISNENKFNEELISHNWQLFYDSLRVAKAIDKKINLRWGKARLEQEHIAMSKEMVNIIYKYDESDLNNKDCYTKFSDFSGYKLIGNMKDLALEGITRKHCVVTYKNSINSQDCGIYSIEDYTLELRESSDGLTIAQFRGYRNVWAPQDLEIKVQDVLDKFNAEVYPIYMDLTKKGIEILPF